MIPTHDELLRERFEALKLQAQDLVKKLTSDSVREYETLAAIVGPLSELAAHFQEPLAFEADARAVATKRAVLEAFGSLVKPAPEPPVEG